MKFKGIAAAAATALLATGCSAQGGTVGTGAAGTTASTVAGTVAGTTNTTRGATERATTAAGAPAGTQRADGGTGVHGDGAWSLEERRSTGTEDLAAYLDIAQRQDRQTRTAEQLVLAAEAAHVTSLDARARAAIQQTSVSLLARTMPSGGGKALQARALRVYQNLVERQKILVRYRNGLDDVDGGSGPQRLAQARACLAQLPGLAAGFDDEIAELQVEAKKRPVVEAVRPDSEAAVRLAAQFVLAGSVADCRATCGGALVTAPPAVTVVDLPTINHPGLLRSGSIELGVAWDRDHWQFEFQPC